MPQIKGTSAQIKAMLSATAIAAMFSGNEQRTFKPERDPDESVTRMAKAQAKREKRAEKRKAEQER